MDKKTKQLAEKLYSADNNVVLEAIEEIQTQGNIEILPSLLELIQNSKNPKIERKAKAIFFGLKDNKAAEFMVWALQNEKYAHLRPFLSSACWNNGLDYSDYLPVFVQLFLNEQFEVAFDAFTVVENLTGFPENSVIEEQIEVLKQAAGTIAEEKKHLLTEFVNLLQNML